MGVWATTSEVGTYTGVTVTDSALAMAEADIEVYANRSPAASAGMGARDLRSLMLATCYQAAWRHQQVGVVGRQSVQTMSQDGMSVGYASEWQVTLAPMAARALKNLSWKSGRTQRTPNVRYPRGLGEYEASRGGALNPSFLDETFDANSDWHDLEGWG